MAQTSLNIRIDEELKENMEQVCQELGINMTTAITIFAKKMTREKRIPFDVSVDPFYSESNLKALDKSREQYKQGNIIVKTLEDQDRYIKLKESNKCIF